MLSQAKWVRTVLAALVVVALLSSGLAWAKKPVPPDPDPPPFTYAVEWIAPLPGHLQSKVWNLNNAGVAVGASFAEDTATSKAIVSSVQNGVRETEDLNSVRNDPDLFWGFPDNYVLYDAHDINSHGQITGTAWVPGAGKTTERAFRYTPGYYDEEGQWVSAVVENLGLVVGTVGYSRGWSINDAGDVVGNWSNSPTPETDPYGGFLFSDGDRSMIDIGRISDGSVAPSAINNAGLVVGTENFTTDGHLAFLYVVGLGMTRISPSESASGLTAEDVNDLGIAVGRGEFVVPVNKKRTTTVVDASRYDSLTDELVSMGVNAGGASGINIHGNIVGRYGPADAWVYIEEFGFLDLTELADAELGAVRTERLKINDVGEISGWTGFDDLMQGFILTPVP